MSGMISESIFSGKTVVIPMPDVQHIEKHFHTVDQANGEKKGDIRGYSVITKHTRCDPETAEWANSIYLMKEEGESFLRAWTHYRYEAESLEENGLNILPPVESEAK